MKRENVVTTQSSHAVLICPNM